METRIFGRTGHPSTLAIFGAAAFYTIDQPAADLSMRRVLDAGVNHIDVAPSYGQAEERLGPWMPSIRGQVFLGCKTMERSRAGAAAELRRSLERLRTDQFDLYQFHAVNTWAELDQVTGPGGALEAVLEARDAGLLRYIGITGHGYQVPQIFLEALRRFDFDSVLFPLNFVQYADPGFRQSAEALLAECQRRNVASMIIKSVCRSPWGEGPHTHTTWYRPFTGPGIIQQAIDFALSQPVNGICTLGDVSVLPDVLAACAAFQPMTLEAQASLIRTAGQYAPLFPTPG
jgi:aryl-alcohol dehydrogenase-like predicted oxidoreductase